MASIRSSATDTLATAGTSHVIDMPAGVVSGDLLVMCIQRGESAPAITFTGWTEKYSGGAGLTVWARISDGTEGATQTFTTASTCIHAVVTYAIKDHFGDLTAIEVSAGVSSLNEGLPPNADSLTPSWGAEATLWIAAHGSYAFSTNTVSSYPSGYTLGQSTVEQELGGIYYSMTTAAKLSSSASEDPGELTMDSTPYAWRAATIGIRPNGSGTLFWSFP